eukprot:2908745-Rhodomonas_salina.1
MELFKDVEIHLWLRARASARVGFFGRLGGASVCRIVNVSHRAAKPAVETVYSLDQDCVITQPGRQLMSFGRECPGGLNEDTRRGL